MTENHSKTYEEAQEIFQQIKLKFLELSKLDLSNLHVHNDWSLIPHVQDHLSFLIDQISGLSESLKDSPPPETSSEVKSIKDSFSESIP